MSTETILYTTPRPFTRREKTLLRQDVKRFEKIGRDHGCVTMEDFANFVTDRLKYDEAGNLTEYSRKLFRGLVTYFGEQLQYNTTLARMANDVEIEKPCSTLGWAIFQDVPGWLLVDRFWNQSVVVVMIVAERIFRPNPWPTSLDDILDQIIDWNQGYIFIDEIETAWISGDDMEPEHDIAA